MNDLPQHVTNEVRIFADDTKLFTQSDEEETRKSLQEDLDSLHQWSLDWLLKFYPGKCCVLQLGHNNAGQIYTMKESPTNGEDRKQLTHSEAEKDLGIIIDRKLVFKNHVEKTTAKANRTLGIIRRTFNHLSDRTFIQLYKTMVRPILEYRHSACTLTRRSYRKRSEMYREGPPY